MDKGGRTARSDLWGGAAWIGFGLAIVVAAWQMDRFESMGASLYTAPGLVPGLLGLTLILLGGLLAGRGARTARAAAGKDAEPLLNRRLGPMLVLSLFYAAVLVGRAPFALSTAAFVAVFTWIYSDAQSPPRRALTALLSGALTATLIVLVFERVFLVRLP